MANKIGVWSLWIIFAIWAYIFLIYTIGFFWFRRNKAKFQLYSKPIIVSNIIAFIITLIGQIFTVVLYIVWGKQIKDSESLLPAGETKVMIYYSVLFAINLLTILATVGLFIFFSNNIGIKFTADKLHIIGMTILYSAIVGLNRTKNGSVELVYVYKKEQQQIWTEKLNFLKCFKTTDFLYETGPSFFDPQRNLAFFNLEKIKKTPKNKTIKKAPEKNDPQTKLKTIKEIKPSIKTNKIKKTSSSIVKNKKIVKNEN